MVLDHRKVLVDEPLDIGEEGAFVDGAERQGDPGGAGPSRASDPVDVAFRLVREVEVDHVRQVDDVEAPAAMSVATSTLVTPRLKLESAFSRAFCDLLPWIASARTA